MVQISFINILILPPKKRQHHLATRDEFLMPQLEEEQQVCLEQLLVQFHHSPQMTVQSLQCKCFLCLGKVLRSHRGHQEAEQKNTNFRTLVGVKA